MAMSKSLSLLDSMIASLESTLGVAPSTQNSSVSGKAEPAPAGKAASAAEPKSAPTVGAGEKKQAPKKEKKDKAVTESAAAKPSAKLAAGDSDQPESPPIPAPAVLRVVLFGGCTATEY
jgi:hypothetical protein